MLAILPIDSGRYGTKEMLEIFSEQKKVDYQLEIEGFTAYFKSYHPSHHFGTIDTSGRRMVRLNTTLVGINTPTRIGGATVMPGDVVPFPLFSSGIGKPIV